jgi:hypothetical protein
MPNEPSNGPGISSKRKRKHERDKKPSSKRSRSDGNEVRRGTVTNVDQLSWKKVSLDNDEFEDFEEIEGVDVEYIEKDGNKLIQFKVYLLLYR